MRDGASASKVDVFRGAKRRNERNEEKRVKKNGTIRIGLLALAAVCLPVARAGIIEVDFSGQISLNDPNNHFNGLFHENEDYTASFTYDSSATPSSIGSAPDITNAHYAPPLSFTVNVGGYVFQSLNSPPYDPNTPAMYVQDYTAGVGNDAFLVVADPIVPDFMTFPDAVYGQMDFIVSDNAGVVFSGTSLPTSFSLDQFQTGGFTLVDFASADFQDRANMSGNLSSFTVTEIGGTPEPATWFLMVSGVSLVGFRRLFPYTRSERGTGR
jgi:hypothetical protein